MLASPWHLDDRSMKCAAYTVLLFVVILVGNSVGADMTIDLGEIAHTEDVTLQFGTNTSSCHPIAPLRFKSLLDSLGTTPETSNFTVMPFFVCASHNPDQETITASTHISFEKFRIENLKRLVKQWHGPVSLSLYVRAGEFQDTEVVKAMLRSWIDANPTTPEFYAQVDIHLVLDHLSIEERRYPYNLMRNIALVSARTRFTLIMDGDILIPTSMNEHLLRFRPELYTSAGRMVLAILTYEIKNSAVEMEQVTEIHDAYTLFELMSKGAAYRACHYKQAGGDVNIWQFGISNATTIAIDFHPRSEFNFMAMTGLDDDTTTENILSPNEIGPLSSTDHFFQMLRESRHSDMKFRRFPLFNTTLVGYGFDRLSHIWDIVSRGFQVRFAAGAFVYSHFHRSERNADTPADYDRNFEVFGAICNSISNRLRDAVMRHALPLSYVHVGYYTLYTSRSQPQELDVAREMFRKRLSLDMPANSSEVPQDEYERLAAALGIVLTYTPVFRPSPRKRDVIELSSEFVPALYQFTEGYTTEHISDSADNKTRIRDCQQRIQWGKAQLEHYGKMPNIMLLSFHSLSSDSIVAMLHGLCECAFSNDAGCAGKVVKKNYENSKRATYWIKLAKLQGKELIRHYSSTNT